MESRTRTADLALQALVASRPSTRVDPLDAPRVSTDLLACAQGRPEGSADERGCRPTQPSFRLPRIQSPEMSRSGALSFAGALLAISACAYAAGSEASANRVNGLIAFTRQD